MKYKVVILMMCLMSFGKGWTNPNVLAHDEYMETPAQAIPTITAGGDFLLPTYMLPQNSDLLVAMNEKEKKQSLNLVVEEHEALPKKQEEKAVSFTLEDEQEVQTEHVKQVGEGVRKKNVFSKVKSRPKQIKKSKEQEDLLKKQQGLMQQVPQSRVVITTEPKQEVIELRSEEADVPLKGKKEEIKVKQEKTEVVSSPSYYDDEEFMAQEEYPVITEAKKEENRPKIRKSLLLPLSQEIEEETQVEEEELKYDPPVRYVVPSRYADTILGLAGRRQISSAFVMPKEIKVSFYPNNYALSGQAMKWLKAFSLGAIQNPSVVIDLRMSSKNPPLQERRLKLIEQVLLQNGLSRHQLKVSWTSRGENSVVLRYVERIDDEEVVLKRGPRREKM